MADYDNPFCQKKDIHVDIAKCLNLRGFPFSAKEVEYKWGNLMRQYKLDLARKDRSGASFQRTPVFDKMQAMLAHRHDIQPVHTIGTGLKRKVDEEEEKPVDVQKKSKMSPSTDLRRQLIEKLDNTLKYFKESDERREEAQRKKEENEAKKLSLLERLVESVSKK